MCLTDPNLMYVENFQLDVIKLSMSNMRVNIVWTTLVYTSLYPVWSKATIRSLWDYTLPCSSHSCTANVTITKKRNGCLWQSPTGWWALMPKLRWVTVSPGLSFELPECWLRPLDKTLSSSADKWSAVTFEQKNKTFKTITLISCMCLTEAKYWENPK